MSLMKLSLLCLSLEDIVVNEHPWSLMMSKFKMKQLSLMQPHTLYIQQRVCHTPIPGQTRLADPNRVRGARPYTGTLYLFFVFFNRIKISHTYGKNYHQSGVHQYLYTYTESHLLIHIQKQLYISITYSERRTYFDELLLVCWPSCMRMFLDVFFYTYTD